MRVDLLFLCFIYSTTSMLLNAQPDFIESFRIINKNKIVVKANKSFSRQFIKEDFFAEYDEKIDLTKLDESIVTIPFILNIAPVVWFSNKTYSIDVMDKELYHSLQKVREVFRMFYPCHSWLGELIPKKLVTNMMSLSHGQDKPVLALLFTGGLDSVNTSISHVDTKQLLITAWGADVKVGASDKWTQVLEQCQKFSQTFGHDHMFVKSNFREFIETPYLSKQFSPWWVNISYGLSLVGLTAPLLALRNISTLFIAASHTAKYPYPRGSHPAIENNISFAGSTVYHAGSDKDRVQKVMNINVICKEKKLPLPHLRVCWLDPLGKNCLKCEKCIRTYISIIIAGQTPRKHGFNIDIRTAIRKMRSLLRARKYLTLGEIHIWQYSVSYLDTLFERTKDNPAIPKKYIKELRECLNSINFERYRNLHVPSYYPPQEHELFATLWEQNMKRDSEIKS